MSIRIAIKVGDQGPDYESIRDGMIVCKLDPSELISDHMMMVYAIVNVPDSWDALITQGLEPNDIGGVERPDPANPTKKRKVIPAGPNARLRKKYIDLAQLAADLGDPSLEAMWRASVPVPISNGTNLNVGTLKNSVGRDFPAVADNNVVTSGSFTVGSGGDYSTWSAALADIGSLLVGNLTFTQISDTAETAQASKTSIDPAGFTLLLDSDTPHAGDPTAGHEISVNYAGGTTPVMRLGFTSSGAPAAGSTIEVKNLRFTATISQAGSDFLEIQAFSNGSQLTRVHDLMLDGASNRDGMRLYQDNVLECWNVVVWDANNISFDIFQSATAGTSTVENCTSLDATGFGYLSGNHAGLTERNNVMMGSGAFDFFSGVSTTRESLSSSDTTASGTGAQTNIVAASEFLSLSDVSSDFLKIDPTGGLGTSGTNPSLSGNTAGIRGDLRPGPDATSSRSADEFNPPSAAGEGTGTGHGEAASDPAKVGTGEGGGTGHSEATSTAEIHTGEGEGGGTGHGEATSTAEIHTGDGEGGGTGHSDALSFSSHLTAGFGTGTGHGEAVSNTDKTTGPAEGGGTGHGEAVSNTDKTTNEVEGGGTGHGEAAAVGAHVSAGEGGGTGHDEATATGAHVGASEGGGTGHGEATSDTVSERDAEGTATGHGEATATKAAQPDSEGGGTGHGLALATGTHPAGSRPIGRDQPPHGASSNFPFVRPSDDIERILGDFYLSYDDPDCELILPLRVAWMAKFGETDVPNFPGRPDPTHTFDLIVEDAVGVIVFDSTTAAGFVTIPFGDRVETVEWKTDAAVCRVTRHTKVKIGDPPLAFDKFIEPVSSELDAITYRQMPRRVNSFRVGLVTIKAENMIWEEGFNLGMTPGEVVSQDGGRRVQPIVFTANPGDGLGRVPACEDTDPLVRKINSVQPTAAGDFILDADGCYRVQRPVRVTNLDPRQVELFEETLTAEQAAAAIQVMNDCGPCCECDDFVNTYEGLRKLDDRYHALGERSEAARDQYALNLARWQNARDCFIKTPMRLVIRQDFGCIIGLGLNFCNLTSECITDLEIRLTMEGFKDGLPDPSMSALEPLCPETVVNGTDTNYEDRSVPYNGAFPAFVRAHDLADPQASQKTRSLFLLSGCANGQTLCITATAHFEGGDVPTLEASDELKALWTSAGLDPDVPMRGLLKKCVALSPEEPCRS